MQLLLFYQWGSSGTFFQPLQVSNTWAASCLARGQECSKSVGSKLASASISDCTNTFLKFPLSWRPGGQASLGLASPSIIQASRAGWGFLRTCILLFCEWMCSGREQTQFDGLGAVLFPWCGFLFISVFFSYVMILHFNSQKPVLTSYWEYITLDPKYEKQ